MRIMLAFLAFLALLAWPRDATACVCGGYERNEYGACRDTDRSQLIFSGTVLSIVNTGFLVTTTFQVREAFRGVSTPTVVLFGGFSNCEFPFEVGESYFVYAAIDPSLGRLGAHRCGGTSLLRDAEQDLAYGHAGREKPVVLGGFVKFYERSKPDDNRHERGLAAVPITLSSADRTLHVITASDGTFSVAHPSPGVYTVHADMPPPFHPRPDGKAIVRAGDCGGYAAFITDGFAELHGRVVDENGHPRQYVTVTAEVAGTPWKSGDTLRGETDALGRYVIRWIVPGPYVLHVNRKEQVPRLQPWPYPDTILAGIIDVAGPFDRTVDDLVIAESTKFRVDK